MAERNPVVMSGESPDYAEALQSGDTVPASAVSPNALLDGAQHSDTVAQTVSRGSLVYGNSTPKWDELIVGAANALLGSDGTDVSWFGCTAAGRAILDDANATAQRTTLGLDGSFVVCATSGTALTVGGGATASEVRWLEPSGGGASYVGFKSPALAGNTVYSWPNAFPAVSGYVLSCTDAGVMSWAAASSGAAWGSITGTLADQTDLQAALDDKIEDGDTVSFTQVTAGVGIIGALAVTAHGAFGLIDTDLSHYLHLSTGSDLTADRTLTLTTGDADRTLTIGADSSISGTAYVVGGTDVPVTDGGTGASTAADARTNLGLAIGTNVQAWDAQLDSLSSASANGVSLVTAADYAAMKALLDLEIGVDVQAYDADLTTWAGITPGTGVGTALAINVGSAGAFVTFNGALGTPSSGTLTNCTGLPVAGGGTGRASHTAYAVLCGGTTTTAAQQSVASVGSFGQSLTSQGAGALPQFKGGMTLLATATASSSGSVDFTLTGWTNSGFNAYLVEISHLAPATDNVEFWLRTSTNGGSSYDAGASDYGWTAFIFDDSAASFVQADAADSEIRLLTAIGNAANEVSSGYVFIGNPSAAKYCLATSDFAATSTSGGINRYHSAGRRISAADVDAIRFLFSSGNIAAGEFRLYGLSNA